MTFVYQETYFLDRALGKSVGYRIQELGVKVELHGNHFQPNSPDPEWLPIVSQKGWIVLTKDKKIKTRTLEVKAIAISNARVFILTSGNLSSQKMRDIFVSAMPKIEKIAQGNQAPFIAKVYKEGKVKIDKNSDALKKLIKD